MSEVKEEIIKITDECKQSCIKQEVAFIEPPIKKLFEISLKSLKRNNTFNIKINDEDLKIKQLLLLKKNSHTWNVYVKSFNLKGLDWFVFANFFNENFFKLEYKSEASRLQQNGLLFLVNKITFIEEKIKPGNKVKIELSYWKITDELNSYISKCEDSITKEFLNISN